MRKIGVTIGILLLLIGSTYAEDNVAVIEDNVSKIVAEDNSSIAREDNVSNMVAEDNVSNMVAEDNTSSAGENIHNSSNITNTSTVVSSVGVTEINDSSKRGDIIFGDTKTIPAENKSSPGFESIVTAIVFLSLVIMKRRR